MSLIMKIFILLSELPVSTYITIVWNTRCLSATNENTDIKTIDHWTKFE